MNIPIRLIFISFLCSISASISAQNQPELISETDFHFLEDMTKVIIDSSRILPGQHISSSFGPNNLGITLIRPGARDAYPSFWIRDYAMSIETGFISLEEQKNMLLLTAVKQCDQTWITKGGAMVPRGAVADHIRIDDGLPIYYPGTYDYVEQGDGRFGLMPPYCDQYFFIHMAHQYISQAHDEQILLEEIHGIRLIDRLENAFTVPPSNSENQLVYTNDSFRGVDFGFRDAIIITGNLCLSSILKYKAALELSNCFMLIHQKQKSAYYLDIAQKIKSSIGPVFQNEKGMLKSSTGKSQQADVWATALAIYYDMLDKEQTTKASRALALGYKAGTLSYHGNIRHVMTSDDFNNETMWEVSLAEKNTYQNGAYWGTPVGWVCYAMAKTDIGSAKQLAAEYIADLKLHDFRKGGKEGAPFECFTSNGGQQNPLYMTTVASPYIVFKKMTKK